MSPRRRPRPPLPQSPRPPRRSSRRRRLPPRPRAGSRADAPRSRCEPDLAGLKPDRGARLQALNLMAAAS